MKRTTKSIAKMKGVSKVAMITAYDALFARLADAAGADIILVGDSLGNTFMGFDSTVPVTLEMMAHHTAAVARANPDAMVLADIPFGCAGMSFDRLLDDCRALYQKASAEAVKIEGGAEIAEKVAGLASAGIAVMGHIGLRPQQVFKLGGYRKFGKTPEERAALVADAKALEEAGAFAVLLEMVDDSAAEAVTKALSVPTIGIGSGPACDGQVLVCTDILGLSSFTPSFAKKYADLTAEISRAYSEYVADVRSGAFPTAREAK